jgi:signal transduction histidine kinase/ActR/RegA family two-component response regulator
MKTRTATARIPKFLSGEGEMARRIREFDWANTSLGDPEQWPESLKSVIGLMLANRFPMLLWWGKEYIQFYNDPYIPIPGMKHPKALGQTGKECWQEIWDVIGPLVDTPFKGGPASWMEDILLKLNRNNFVEETHFIIAYSPMPDANAPNGIGGVLATVNEITQEIFGKRQMETLRKLGQGISATLSVDEVYAQATSVLGENPLDIPFAMVHKIDGEGTSAALAATAGIGMDHPALDSKIDIQNAGRRWTSFAKTVRENTISVSDSGSWHDLPTGEWDIPPNYFAHIPIHGASRKRPVAVVTVALNPYRKFDDNYQNFLHLIADQISFGVSNAIAYEEEKKRAKVLEELDRAKTIFFSNISHEFRTPLTLILGTIEEGLNDAATNPANAERMKLAHRNAMRLLKLVNTLLDFSRIESGRQKATYETTDLASVTENLAGNFRSVVEKAGLELHVRVDDHMPRVYVDRQMWEKIVFNLMSNAFKYTLEGSIEVSVSSRGDHAILQVKDTGTGIPENELPRMFERFHRVENPMGRTYEGTGIGLSLTKELIQLHGGTISVESKQGVGTCFTVSIPFGRDHLPLAQVSVDEKDFGNPISDIFMEEAISLLTETPTPQKGTNLNGHTTCVLVVDDNADMRQHMRSLLEQHYTVVTAANGKEALELIEARKPALVLSDIMMPVMDGIQLLKEIKSSKRHSQIPVILLTARAGEESKVEGLKFGADDYLVKPFSSTELFSRINAQISISEKRKEAENRLREFLMQAPAAIAVVECPDYVFTICNSLYEKVFSPAGKQLIGLPMRQVFPADEQAIYELCDKVSSTGETYVGSEIPVKAESDGKVKTGYFDIVIHPIKDSHGKVANLMFHAVDTTVQVQARQKIEASEKQFKNVLLQSPSIFLILEGPDMVITFCNDPLLTSWGKTKEIVGKPLLEVLPELEGQPFPSQLREVYATGKTCNGKEEKAVLVKEGMTYEVYYNYVYQPIVETDGAVSGITIMANDVTEQVVARRALEKSAAALEEQVSERTATLEQKNIELERINKELASFTYIASHDLQEPLRKIQTFTYLIKDSETAQKDVGRYLDKIKFSAERMSEMISSVLAYSKLSPTNAEMTLTDLNKVLETVKGDFELLIEEKHAVIESDRLPSIHAVPVSMQQLFANLISNSLKFSEQQPVIRITSRIVEGTEVEAPDKPGSEQKFAEITFGDNGIGFEPEYRDQIFKLFQRLHGKTKYSGTGVGLSIVAKIVEHHHGFIKADSQKNKGATFTVWLPIDMPLS